jgi:DNA-binding response OmpR family regulator
MTAIAHAALIPLSGPADTTALPLDPQAACTIGRGSSCTLVVELPLVSRVHARISHDGSRFMLADAGSVNGTYLNGTRLSEPAPLMHGDRIGLADAAPALEFYDPDSTRVSPHQLRLDIERQQFYFEGSTLDLTRSEFKLLLHLRANSGRLCTRASCVRAVWHSEQAVESYRAALDQLVYQIRTKIAQLNPRVDLIDTVRGEGYMLAA